MIREKQMITIVSHLRWLLAMLIVITLGCGNGQQDWSKKDAEFLIEKLSSENWQNRVKAAAALGQYGGPLLVRIGNPWAKRIDSFFQPTTMWVDPSFPEEVEGILNQSGISLSESIKIYFLDYSVNGKAEQIWLIITDQPSAPRYTVRKEKGTLYFYGQTEASVLALINALSDEMAPVRSSSAKALGWMKHATEPVVAALIRTLDDEDSMVRASAAEALGEMGEAAIEAVPSLPVVAALIRTLDDEDSMVRASAVEALGEMGEAAIEAVPSLIKQVNEGDKWERRSAVVALGKIGKPTETIVPLLIRSLKDESAGVRMVAAYGLRIGDDMPESVVPVLIEALSDPHWGVRANTVGVLGGFETAAKTIKPALEKSLNDEKEEVRRNAASALAMLGYMDLEPSSKAISFYFRTEKE